MGVGGGRRRPKDANADEHPRDTQMVSRSRHGAPFPRVDKTVPGQELLTAHRAKLPGRRIDIRVCLPGGGMRNVLLPFYNVFRNAMSAALSSDAGTDPR